MDNFDDRLLSTLDDSFKLIRFPPSRHSSALTFSPQKEVQTFWARNSAETQTLPAIDSAVSRLKKISGIGKYVDQVSIMPHIVYYHIFSSAYRKVQTVGDSLLVDALSAAVENVVSELQALENHHPALAGLAQGLRKLDRLSLAVVAEELSLLNGMRRFLNRVRNTCQLLQVKNSTSNGERIMFDGLTAEISYPIIFFTSQFETRMLFLLNYDQLLMLSDTTNCRFMTLLTCLLNHFLRSDELPCPDLIRKLYSWGDSLILSCGHNAYCIIESVEDIVTNTLVNFPGSDPLGLGQTFTCTLLASIEEKCKQYSVPMEGAKELMSILKGIKSVNVLSEVFGLRKHWGNPMVDAEKSSLAVIEKVTEDLPVSGVALINLHASFVRMITLEYIKQNGEWPKGEFIKTRSLPTYPLERAFSRGVTRLPEMSAGHRHTHWSLFRFFPNCTIDSFDNPLDIISDKSVSLYRHNLDHIFIDGLRGQSLKSRPVELRRLILEYLREEKPSISSIFTQIMTGNIPPDWLANSACMKGTEMKHEKARLFAVLPYELRQYFVATEELIKKHIFKYNPHQTMTMDEPTLLARLREVTKQMDVTSDSRYLSVMHIIDFSKWNLRMKYLNTSSVFRSIDEFLGTPALVEMTHPLFSAMLNVIQDPFHPPPESVLDTESNKIWRFHNRGWEGQRQKGWTALTSALLSDLQRRTGVNSLICGQGDNQTLLSSFRIPDRYRNAEEWIIEAPNEVRQIIDGFYSLLSSECEAVGLKVKTGESCRSLCYFNYGKRLFFKGVELSMVLKRISKNMTESNSSYPVTEMLLKTVQGSATASGLFSHQSVLPIIVGKLSTLLQLWESFTVNPLLGDRVSQLFQKNSLQINLKLCSLISRVPPTLGGPSQPCILDYFFRGHPDPAAGEFALLTMLARSGYMFESKILFAASQKDSFFYNSRKEDRTSLIMAPFSLNLNLPKSAGKPLAEMVFPALRSFCQNKQVKDLFSNSSLADEKLLLHILGGIRPFSPLVANDIFSRTPSGRRLSFVSGLTNTTSLGRLVVDSRTSPVVERVVQLELEQLTYWIELVKKIVGVQVERCWVVKDHYTTLQEAREFSWGCEVVGVTVPHPSEQFVLTKAPDDLCSGECKAYHTEHIVFAAISERLYGPHTPLESNHPLLCRCKGVDPFVGNTISEGIIQRQLLCLNPDSSWVDSVRLNLVRLWITSENEELDSFLQQLIGLRTNTPLSVLNLATGRPSRISYNHRASLMATVKTCSPSCTTNFQSRFYLSSNRMGRFSHGPTNYHMPFGPCFLFFTYCLGLKTSLCGIQSVVNQYRTIFHAHVRDLKVPEVFDGEIRIDPCEDRQKLVTAPPALFRDYHSLIFQMVDKESHSTLWQDLNKVPIREARRAYAHQLLGDLLVDEIIRHESSIGLTKGDYPSKPDRISAGDIALVGLDNYLHAISEIVVLMAPTYVFEMGNDSGLYQAITDYLSGFSPQFWNILSEPFRISRLTEQLLMWSPHLAVQNLTRATSGVAGMLRRVVALYATKLASTHRDSVIKEQRVTSIGIRAPTMKVLRLLLSRYFELSILCIQVVGREKVRDRSFYARDMGTNINCIDPEQVRFAINTILRDFMIISSRLGVPLLHPPALPLFYSLTEPWIDTVKATRPQDIPERPPTNTWVPQGWRIPLRMENIYIGDQGRVIPGQECSCPRFPGSWRLRFECLLTDTGILSKSHYRFCEIILSQSLCPESVICLGSSTGTEAASISRMQECQNIFINCLHPLDKFAPHMAATYVPSGFLIDGMSSKLRMSGQSAVCLNDLLHQETITSIHAHTAGICWSGITCDVELADDQLEEDQIMLIHNICQLIQKLSILPNFWVIIKIGVDCSHQLHRLLFPLSSLFFDLSIIRSNFTRAGSRLIMVLCKNFKRGPSHFLPPREENQVFESMVISNFGSQLLFTREEEIYPGCLIEPGCSRVDISRMRNLSSRSLLASCEVYLPGFAPSEFQVSSRQMAKQSIITYIESCSRTVRELVGVYARANKELSMIRSGILMIDDTNINVRLQSIGYRVFKARILYKCLSLPRLDLAEVQEVVDSELTQECSLRIGSIRYIIKIDASRFIHLTSRYLCEIIGVLFDHTVVITDRVKSTQPYHRRGTGISSSSPPRSFLEAPITKMCPVFNNKWYWEDRAVLLSALFFSSSQKSYPSDSQECYLPNSFMLASLNVRLGELGFAAGLKIANKITDQSGLIWIEDPTVLQGLSIPAQQYKYLLLDVMNICRLPEGLNVVNIIRIPWLGVVPRKVLVILSGVSSPYPIAADEYPDLDEMARWTDEEGSKFVGCACNDCNSEYEILQSFNMTSRDMNLLCGWKKVTSVFDKFH